MPGFVKVSNEVFRYFRKLAHKGVVWRLYELADANRWEPFRCSDSYLIEEGITKRDVRTVIGEMESMGLLAIVKSGDRHNARVLRLIEPGTTTRTTGIENAGHWNGGDTNDIGQSVPRPVPQPVPQPVLKNQTTEKTADSDGQTLTAEFALALDAYNQGRIAQGKQRHNAKRASAGGRKLIALIKRHGINDVVALFKWWGTSMHDRAVFYREKSLGLDTIHAKSEDLVLLMVDGEPLARGDYSQFKKPIEPESVWRAKQAEVKAKIKANREARESRMRRVSGK